MSSSPIVVLVKYQTQPGQDQIARRQIAALVATVTASEPECKSIAVLQDSGDPTVILLVEHWTDHATFVGPHMQQPHIQAFMQQAGAFLAGPPDISFWHPVGGA